MVFHLVPKLERTKGHKSRTRAPDKYAHSGTPPLSPAVPSYPRTASTPAGTIGHRLVPCTKSAGGAPFHSCPTLLACSPAREGGAVRPQLLHGPITPFPRRVLCRKNVTGLTRAWEQKWYRISCRDHRFLFGAQFEEVRYQAKSGEWSRTFGIRPFPKGKERAPGRRKEPSVGKTHICQQKQMWGTVTFINWQMWSPA